MDIVILLVIFVSSANFDTLQVRHSLISFTQKYLAKYWELWHTAYNVSPVGWFTVYNNALFSLGISVFEPYKNFSQLSMWLTFLVIAYGGLFQTFFEGQGKLYLRILSRHKCWIHRYKSQLDSLSNTACYEINVKLY